MLKFQFNMESVLQYRENVENRKKEELADSLQKTDGEKKLLDGLLHNQEKNFFTSCTDKGDLNIDMLRQNQAYSELLNTKIQIQKNKLIQAHKNVKKHRLQLAEAAKKRMIIENLKEKKFQEHCDNLNKEDQKLLDEAGINAYFRKAE